ncbi:hypothetical protein N7501_007571 [Penicillium viridicatum]|nr:hypothetical protein N7501_007571 [Penicillium viridicatum]
MPLEITQYCVVQSVSGSPPRLQRDYNAAQVETKITHFNSETRDALVTLFSESQTDRQQPQTDLDLTHSASRAVNIL